MLQIYFLSIVFLILSSFILLLDYYREELSFLLRFRALMRESKKVQFIYFISGIGVAVLMLFFPVYPGPMLLGDFIPAMAVLLNSFYFIVAFSEKNKERGLAFNGTKLEERKKLAGIISLLIAFLHFLFPSFVLI